MLQKKNTNPGIVKFIFLIFIFLSVNISKSNTSEIKDQPENFVAEINILDKVSSKNTILKINIGKEKKFQNLLIKVLKCENSNFDDDPEITAYLQVKDLNISNNEKVFVFNGWMFSSSPSIAPFDHPVYDIWLVDCY